MNEFEDEVGFDVVSDEHMRRWILQYAKKELYCAHIIIPLLIHDSSCGISSQSDSLDLDTRL